MAAAFLGAVTALTTTMVWQDPVHYSCGSRTFRETPVSVSMSEKFVTDVTANSMQNLSLLLEPHSFIIDVTGCLTPIGEVRPAVGIEIVDQKLPNLYAGAIQHLYQLRMIKIEYCRIEDIDPGAFLILPSVEVIFLRFNRLGHIREGVFNDLRVSKLYLSNNSITNIDSGAFDNMSYLSTIELNNNKLKTWNTDWFTNTPNVQHVSLDSNLLTTLPANAFKKLKNYYFTSIRLSNNDISFIHPTAFQELTFLYALWLDNNNIHNLDDRIFQGLERLYILSLRGNKIACLSDELLYGLKSEVIILRVEDNEPMKCECLRKIQNWARSRSYFFTERYAKAECIKKKGQEFTLC